ncbi:restriction endonuclease subunit S [Aeromonas veronii]
MKWIDTTVGDYCPFIYGKGLPQNKRIQGEFPVYGSNGIVDSHSESLIQTPGIIIGRKGSCGAVNISTGAFWPIDTTFYVTKDSLHELYFTYYLLKTLGLETMNSDSAVPGLNRDNAHNVRIRIPEKKEDREKLGYKLFVFDNKIANNTAMNQTLEKIAQRIFKSWFIDFDPVKANAEGVPFNGLSPEIQALFPSEFEESELGMIPCNWSPVKISQIIDINPSYKLLKGSEPYYIDMKALPIDSMSINDLVRREFKSGTKFKNGDTLMARITPCLENGKTGLVAHIPNDEVAWGSTEFIVMSPRTEKYKEFVYLLARNSELRAFAIKSMTGTSGRQRVSGEQVGSYLVVNIPDDIIAAFNQVVAPLFEKVSQNTLMSKSLENIRDKLLPRLMTGQISLSKANQELKETV